MPYATRSRRADMVWVRHELGYRSWDVDHASWVVTLNSLEEQIFYGHP